MKKFELESRLNEMKGHLFMYNKKNQRVLRSDIKERSVKVVTDVEDIIFLPEDAEKILDDFLPVSEDKPAVVINNYPVASTQQSGYQTILGSSGAELKDILLENIKKVQENKEYIAQATEVNNNVKSIIDLAKAEVELIKASRTF